jgi:hypothetical protein
MSNESRAIAQYIERLVADIVKELHDLPDELLNWPWPIPDANTLFAMATHTVGMGEFWVLSLVGGAPSDRNRDAEFRANGHGPDIIARLNRWVQDCHALLADMPDNALDRIVQLPEAFWRSGGFDSPEMSARDALLHVLEHTATHLGHIQLGRQIVLGARDGRFART